MKIRTVLLAVAATSAISTSAFAASFPWNLNHPASREGMTVSCAVLERQYDKVIEDKRGAAQSGKAESLHAQGVKQCDSPDSDMGVQKLQQSLRILGVKPAA